MITIDFIQELENLTQQKASFRNTEFGFEILAHPNVLIYLVELSKINRDIDFSQVCKNNEILLFENEWNEKRAVVLSRIQNLLGNTKKIYARNTKVAKLTRTEVFDFLQQNHFNVAIKSKYGYGLYFHNELVAVAAFGPIMNKTTEQKGERSGELIRFCNKNNHSVIGGLSKLLKHFITVHLVDDVMTYVDKDWSNGKSFVKLGFKKVSEKNDFSLYFNPSNQQFESASVHTVSIKKRGLIKLIFKTNLSKSLTS